MYIRSKASTPFHMHKVRPNLKRLEANRAIAPMGYSSLVHENDVETLKWLQV